MNTYHITHRAACPNGQLMDAYKITISSPMTIMVELILETLKNAPDPIFQEGLADYLRAKLGARIVIEGWHYGILIVCERE